MNNSNYSDVIESMKKIRVSDAFMKLPEPYIVTFDTFFNIAVKALEDRPTGKWKFDTITEFYGPWYICSICGKPSIYGNYCPNCGTRMEKEE